MSARREWIGQEYDREVVEAALRLGGHEAVALVPTPRNRFHGTVQVADETVGRITLRARSRNDPHPTHWEVRGFGPQGMDWQAARRVDLGTAVGLFLYELLRGFDLWLAYHLAYDSGDEDAYLTSSAAASAQEYAIQAYANTAARAYCKRVRVPVRITRTCLVRLPVPASPSAPSKGASAGSSPSRRSR